MKFNITGSPAAKHNMKFNTVSHSLTVSSLNLMFLKFINMRESKPPIRPSTFPRSPFPLLPDIHVCIFMYHWLHEFIFGNTANTSTTYLEILYLIQNLALRQLKYWSSCLFNNVILLCPSQNKMAGLRFAQTSAVRKERKHSKSNKTLKVNKGATKISKTNLSRQD